MSSRFEIHSHTMYSNLRLLDCINRPKDLIDRAVDLGLAGITITDHECLSSHMEVNIYAQEMIKQNPNFKIALGNEIYLTSSREMGQKYYHFILIAKNKTGHRALRELSSRAWLNSYYDRGMERVVTLYDDLKEIVNKYPNDLIATTACLGGEVSAMTKALIEAEKHNDFQTKTAAHQDIISFILMCKELFGEDFYIECAPACSLDQIKVNQRLVSIAQAFNLKMVIGSDAHFLKKEDRYVHKAYLNSKGGEREVDDFYEYAYLQSNEEVFENLKKSNFDDIFIEQMFDNSLEIWNKIENYSLLHKQTIPKVEVENYPKKDFKKEDKAFGKKMKKYPTLKALFESEDKVERYWINQCWENLSQKIGNPFENLDYVSRLEEEADIKRTIGQKLETNMFAYPVTLQHYVDLFWKCGSTVGAGRGSSCSGLNHYLLGITQLDPLVWHLPFWRYLNKERVELGDIDLDLCPSKRPYILKEIKKERGQNFEKEIDNISRENLGCTLIATFGTEGTRSAILTACRGYRSDEYPDGIDVDTAQYLSSLIPSERGFLWSLNDVVNGNPEKDRKPNNVFLNEVKKYKGLLNIMMAIEGLVNKRSSHASGVIFFDENPYEFGCFMRTPKGEVITQYDLHMCEAAGMTKYDFLVTEIQDKIVKCIQLMQEQNILEKDLSLREIYNKYLHPEVLPLDNKKCWDALCEGNVLNVFQFDSEVGSQAAKKIQPRTILEMSDSNGLMRLMTSEKGEETPLDKYVRFKNDISLWYKEMSNYGLTEKEIKIVEPYFKPSYGVPPSQEQLMQMLMDKDICHFTLAEANTARKIVGKKQMSKIPELQEKVLSQAASPCLGHYIWQCGVKPQLGYSFSTIHALAYSFIGYQTLYLATNWNSIFWNTACLIVNSGSLENDDNKEEDKRVVGTDYTKLAKALGDILSKNIKISLVDINNSGYSFKPDLENNTILFGMKGLNKVGDPIIEQIITGRPYTGIVDFINRCPLNKTVMISLIKAGAFDKIDDHWAKEINSNTRKVIMTYYLTQVCGFKKKITLQNFNGLIQKNLVSESLTFEKEVFLFNKFLKANQKKGDQYVLNDKCYTFYERYFDLNLIDFISDEAYISQSDWDKEYQLVMDNARVWIKENQQQILDELNQSLFLEAWNKYAVGELADWEMESLCFYYNEHPLKKIDTEKYGIVDFKDLPVQPEAEYYTKRKGNEIPIYKTYKIVGTVIGKNDARSSISLLTTSGVVNVKFTKDYFAMYNRQISEKQADGSKKIVDKGWMNRGTKVMVTGFRREDTFQAKTYKHTPTHQFYKITSLKNREMTLEHERAGLEEEIK